MRDLRELKKLEKYIRVKRFEYERRDHWRTLFDRHQLIVYDHGIESWDVVCHHGSKGYEMGLLEGYGGIFGNDPVGYLTADDIIQMIEEDKNE